MTEHTQMAERKRPPDYELDETMEVGAPEQYRALGDPTRQKIAHLLLERAASTKQLAETLGQPVGSVGHHLKVLREAGLIRVVRTRQVRAMTEKYYGLRARSFHFSPQATPPETPPYHWLQLAINEYATDTHEADGSLLPTHVLEHARVPASRAEEFVGKVIDLASEFGGLESVPGERVYGFVAGVYLTDLPDPPRDKG